MAAILALCHTIWGVAADRRSERNEGPGFLAEREERSPPLQLENTPARPDALEKQKADACGRPRNG